MDSTIYRTQSRTDLDIVMKHCKTDDIVLNHNMPDDIVMKNSRPEGSDPEAWQARRSCSAIVKHVKHF